MGFWTEHFYMFLWAPVGIWEYSRWCFFQFLLCFVGFCLFVVFFFPCGEFSKLGDGQLYKVVCFFNDAFSFQFHVFATDFSRRILLGCWWLKPELHIGEENWMCVENKTFLPCKWVLWGGLGMDGGLCTWELSFYEAAYTVQSPLEEILSQRIELSLMIWKHLGAQHSRQPKEGEEKLWRVKSGMSLFLCSKGWVFVSSVAQSAWRDWSIIHTLFCEHECFLPQNKSGSGFTESVHHFFCWVAWVGCSLLFKSFSSSAFWWREFLFTGCQHSEIGLWAWFWQV